MSGLVPEVVEALLSDEALRTELTAPPAAAAIPFADDHERFFLAVVLVVRDEATSRAALERVIGAAVRRLHASGRLAPYGGVEITVAHDAGARLRRLVRASIPTLAVERDPAFEHALSDPHERDITVAWFDPPATGDGP